MPLKIVPPEAGRTPHYHIRGTHLGVYFHRSTKSGRLAVAKTLKVQWERAIERGELGRAQTQGFAGAALSYIQASGNRQYLGIIIEKIGRLPIEQITQAVIDQTAIDLYPDASPATRNRQVYTPISAVLKHAGVEKEIKRPKGWRGRKLTHWLTPERALSIFPATARIRAPKETRIEFRILLRMLCYTGMRLSEPLRLNCRDVSLKDSTATLYTTKGGQARLVHLPPVVVEDLKRLPRGLAHEGRVFRFHKGGRLYDLLAMTLEAAQITLPERVAFHVFCHTWGTWMRQYGGLDNYDLTKTDRWADPESAERYAHVVVSEQSLKADLLPGAKKRTA